MDADLAGCPPEVTKTGAGKGDREQDGGGGWTFGAGPVGVEIVPAFS